MSSNSDWYIHRGDQQRGPYTLEQMRQYAAQGSLKPDDLVWRDGLASWSRAAEVAELHVTTQPGATPPAGPTPVQPSHPAAPAKRGSKWGIGLFFGLGCGVLALAALCGLLFFFLLPDDSPDVRKTSSADSLVIEPSGGTYQSGDLTLSVPAGAVAEPVSLSIQRGELPVDEGEEETPSFRSDAYEIIGPLNEIDGPIEISLQVPNDAFSSDEGETMLIVEEAVVSPSYGPVTNRRVLSTTPDPQQGKLTATLEMQAVRGVGSQPGSGSGVLAARRPLSQENPPTDDTLVIRAESGWIYDILSSDHFRVSFLGKYIDEQAVRAGIELLEQKRAQIIDLGFSFGDVDQTDVYIRPLKDRAGQFVPSKRSASACTLELSSRYFYSMDHFNEKISDLKATMGHEMLHLVQYIADPRWPYTKAVSPGPTLWMDEASATWFEPLAVGDPGFLPPNAVLYTGFIHTPLLGAPDKIAQDHGYGASAFLRHLTGLCGDNLVSSTYDIIKNGTRTGMASEAFVKALDGCGTYPGLEWAPFLEKFYTAPENIFSGLTAPVVTHNAVLTATALADGSDFEVAFSTNTTLAAAVKSNSKGQIQSGPPAVIDLSFAQPGLSAEAFGLSISRKNDGPTAFATPGQVVVTVDAPQDAGVLVYGVLASGGWVTLAGAPFNYLSSEMNGNQIIIDHFGLSGEGETLVKLLFVVFNSGSSYQNPQDTATINVQLVYEGQALVPPPVETVEPTEETAPPADSSNHACAGVSLGQMKTPLSHTSKCWLTCFGIGSGEPSDAEIQDCIDRNQ